MNLLAADGATIGNPAANIGIFALFVAVTLYIVIRASKKNATAAECTAGLPHVLMRFYTVQTAKEARRSVVWAIVLIGAFYVFTLALGYGAAALVGPDVILAEPGAQNSAAPLLAFELGGVVLLGVISAVAFATILAVVAGLTMAA